MKRERYRRCRPVRFIIDAREGRRSIDRVMGHRKLLSPAAMAFGG